MNFVLQNSSKLSRQNLFLFEKNWKSDFLTEFPVNKIIFVRGEYVSHEKNSVDELCFGNSTQSLWKNPFNKSQKFPFSDQSSFWSLTTSLNHDPIRFKPNLPFWTHSHTQFCPIKIIHVILLTILSVAYRSLAVRVCGYTLPIRPFRYGHIMAISRPVPGWLVKR